MPVPVSTERFFGLIDVLPALANTAAIRRHIEEYIGPCLSGGVFGGRVPGRDSFAGGSSPSARGVGAAPGSPGRGWERPGLSSRRRHPSRHGLSDPASSRKHHERVFIFGASSSPIQGCLKFPPESRRDIALSSLPSEVLGWNP